MSYIEIHMCECAGTVKKVQWQESGKWFEAYAPTTPEDCPREPTPSPSNGSEGKTEP